MTVNVGAGGTINQHPEIQLIGPAVDRAGGDRTRDRGITRWRDSVGIVWWGRIHPNLKENLSVGVGLVRWRRFGLWDETWDSASQSIRQLEPICHGFRCSFQSNDQRSDHQESSNPKPRACTGSSLTTAEYASIDQRRRLRFVARHRRTLPGKRRYQRRRSIQVQTQISKRSCRH